MMCERYIRCDNCKEQFETLREVRTKVGVQSLCDRCLGIAVGKPEDIMELEAQIEKAFNKLIIQRLTELINKDKLRVSVDRYGVPSLELDKD